MKFNRRMLVVGLTVMMVALLSVAVAYAASVSIVDYTVDACDEQVTVDVYFDTSGFALPYLDIEVNGDRQSPDGFPSSLSGTGTESRTLDISAVAVGDTVTVDAWLNDDGWFNDLNSSVSFVKPACGGTSSKKDKEKEIPYTGVNLINESDQALYQSVPDAAGQLPCGVFNVNGWGRKYVGLADFPACSAPVTVMCLNGDLEWTADSVSDVVMQGEYEVDFTSSQHGLCALFNQ